MTASSQDGICANQHQTEEARSLEKLIKSGMSDRRKPKKLAHRNKFTSTDETGQLTPIGKTNHHEGKTVRMKTEKTKVNKCVNLKIEHWKT